MRPYNEWSIFTMKLQYSFTRQFSFGGFAPEPPDPTRGKNPCIPPLGGVYIIPGCKVFMGYKYDWKQRPLNQEDNQAPQPQSPTWRLIHRCCICWTMFLLGPGKFLIFIFMLEDQLKLRKNSVSPWLLP
jgi:hypothetical protein